MNRLHLPPALSRDSIAGMLALLLASACASAYAITPGELAPVLNLPAREGNPVIVPDKKAKLTYVDFWASWCGPCRQSFPWLNRMNAQYASKGLRIVGVNLDANRADADKFLAEFPAQFEVVFDTRGTSGKAYTVRGMPSAVLLGPDGKVLAVHQGFRSGDAATLEAQIKSALGKP